MKFEWDKRKSRTNESKHGIDFNTARKLWMDEDRVEVQTMPIRLAQVRLVHRQRLCPPLV